MRLNLSKGGKTLLIDIEGDLTKPYALAVIDSKTKEVLYFRQCSLTKLWVNIPFHNEAVAISIVRGKAKIKSVLQSPLRFVKDDDYRLIPEVKRNFSINDVKTQFVDDLHTTPARFFWKGENAGLLQISRRHMATMAKPTQDFIKLHELAHYYFDTEHKTDRLALHWFLAKGYNLSQAANALKVLGRSAENLHRKINNMVEISKINSKYND